MAWPKSSITVFHSNCLIDHIYSQFEHDCIWHGRWLDICRILGPRIGRVAIGEGSVTSFRNRVGCIYFWCGWLDGHLGGWMGLSKVRTTPHIAGVGHTNGGRLVPNYVRQKRMVPLSIPIFIRLCRSFIVCRNSVLGCRGVRRQVRSLPKYVYFCNAHALKSIFAEFEERSVRLLHWLQTVEFSSVS